jgi:hypothetical protein
MSGPEDEVSQAEKRRIIREQATTMFQHAQAQANELSQGRFAALGTPHVTGSSPIPCYPAAAAHQRDPVPTEPPLGFSVDQVEPIEPSAFVSSVEDPGGAEAPSDPGLSEHAAPPSSPTKGEGNG